MSFNTNDQAISEMAANRREPPIKYDPALEKRASHTFNRRPVSQKSQIVTRRLFASDRHLHYKQRQTLLKKYLRRTVRSRPFIMFCLRKQRTNSAAKYPRDPRDTCRAAFVSQRLAILNDSALNKRVRWLAILCKGNRCLRKSITTKVFIKFNTSYATTAMFRVRSTCTVYTIFCRPVVVIAFDYQCVLTAFFF
jgi:hypothetical protein